MRTYWFMLCLLVLCLLPSVPTVINAAPLQQSTFTCANVTEIPTSECEALVTLYNGTNGPNWLNHTGWLVTNTPCTWYGVTCLFGNVEWLLLANNQLSGTLSPGLNRLSNLVFLDFSNNQLRGAIPREWGSLTKLGALYLDNNQLSGRIPLELGNLPDLQTLNLGKNYLSGPIPPELGNLAKLQVLALDTNRLIGGIPPELGNLSNLTEFYLHHNQLYGTLPLELANLYNLGTLGLDNNQLSGPIPANFGQLTNLTYLSLGHNQFGGALPAELVQLTRLNTLYLGANHLEGALPAWLGQLTNLTTLALDDNQLTGPIPPELGNLTELTRLWLGHNGLSGALPIALSNLSRLGLLDLSSNQLSGALPPQLGNLPRLYQLDLHANQFNGVLPVELSQLLALQQLRLSDNQLTGTIPAQLGALTNLLELDLGHNQLQGELPATLGNLSNLLIFNGEDNHLQGALPAAFGQLARLTQLSLADNQLGGSLPGELTNLSQLTALNLAYDGFTADDATLRAFLDVKAPNWAATQTVAPSNVQAKTQASNALALTWAPISYTLDGGYYEVSYATAAAGPYTVYGYTPHKLSAGYTVVGLQPNTTYYLRVRSYTPAHHSQRNAVWSAYSASVTATTAPPGQGDAYENDDACDLARPIIADGNLMDHTFHQPGDSDWVQFNATAGVTYRIEAQIPTNSPADVNLDLFGECNGALLDQWHKTFSPGVQLDFTAPASGPIYLKLTNTDPAQGAPTFAYRLAVRTLSNETPNGALIIVAGRLTANDPLQANVHQVTQAIYALFHDHGYSADAIAYLASDATLAGVDAAPSTLKLRDAIVSWAVNKVNADHALTLYIVTQGANNQLWLDQPNNDGVTPAALNSWLTQLEASAPGVKLNVIIEASQASNFVRRIDGLSKAGRVIITSTDGSQTLQTSVAGLAFSDAFLTALRQGQHLFSSFWEAHEALVQLPGVQTPLLDADGNSTPNEIDDALFASLRGFAWPGTLGGDNPLSPPYIVSATRQQNVLTAEVRDDKTVQQVRALLYSRTTPSFTPQASIGLQALGNNRYQATDDRFAAATAWRIVVEAIDDDGLAARPFAVDGVNGTLGNQRLFLPLVQR